MLDRTGREIKVGDVVQVKPEWYEKKYGWKLGLVREIGDSGDEASVAAPGASYWFRSHEIELCERKPANPDPIESRLAEIEKEAQKGIYTVGAVLMSVDSFRWLIEQVRMLKGKR